MFPQGFLYDVATPFFVAPYHFARGSLAVDADRFFIYNITVAGASVGPGGDTASVAIPIATC